MWFSTADNAALSKLTSGEHSRETIHDRLRRRQPDPAPTFSLEIFPPEPYLHLPPARRPLLRPHRPAVHIRSAGTHRLHAHLLTRRTRNVAATPTGFLLQGHRLQSRVPSFRHKCFFPYLRRPVGQHSYHPLATPHRMLRILVPGKTDAQPYHPRHD